MGWVSEEVVVDAVNDEQRHSFDAQESSSSKLERGQRVVSHAFKSLVRSLAVGTVCLSYSLTRTDLLSSTVGYAYFSNNYQQRENKKKLPALSICVWGLAGQSPLLLYSPEDLTVPSPPRFSF